MTRSTLLAGAALLCLAASPVLAGESTPAEKEATRQLNVQAALAAAPALQEMAAEPTLASAQSLSDIVSPPSRIATANVLDSSGKTVGAVQKVEVSPEGKPTKVSVALIGAKTRIVVLDAANVSYDAHKNEITARGDIPAAG